MANLILSPSFDATVPSIGINDAVRGAEDGSPNNGIVNNPHIKLGNRTAYLKENLDLLRTDYNVQIAGQGIDNFYYAIVSGSAGFYKNVLVPLWVPSLPGLSVRTIETQFVSDVGTEPGYVRIMRPELRIHLPRGHNKINWEMTTSGTDVSANNKFRLMVYYFLPGTSPYCWQFSDVEYSGDVLGNKAGSYNLGSEIQEGNAIALSVTMKMRTAAAVGSFVQTSNVRLWTSII